MRPYIETIARISDSYVICYPNAGMFVFNHIASPVCALNNKLTHDNVITCTILMLL